MGNRLKYYFLIVIIFFLLYACGGKSSDDLVPPGFGNTDVIVSGTIEFGSTNINGLITAFDFTGGFKGTEIGSQVNLGDSFSFKINRDGVSTILFEISGRCYFNSSRVYEYGTKEAIYTPVVTSEYCLSGAEKITVLYDLANGLSDIVLSPFTFIAHGLAIYNINQGDAPNRALTKAYLNLDNLFGFNILNTSSKGDMTGFTDNDKFKLLSYALKQLPYELAKNDGVIMSFGTFPYTSFHLQDRMRQDLVNDGLLDGDGLIIGANVLDNIVYTHTIAKIMMSYVWTGVENGTITISNWLNYVNNYNNSNNSILGTITNVPLDELGPSITLLNTPGITVSADFIFDAKCRDFSGLITGESEILVDGTLFTNNFIPYDVLHSINTTIIVPNGIHTFTFYCKNILGSSNFKNIDFNVQN